MMDILPPAAFDEVAYGEVVVRSAMEAMRRNVPEVCVCVDVCGFVCA